jgi:hypothetical protein
VPSPVIGPGFIARRRRGCMATRAVWSSGASQGAREIVEITEEVHRERRFTGRSGDQGGYPLQTTMVVDRGDKVFRKSPSESL